MSTRIFPVLLSLVGMAASPVAAEKIVLREDQKPGGTAAVSLEFKANGELHVPQGDKKGAALKLAAQGRVAFEEKLLPGDTSAKVAPIRSLRYYTAASVESVVEENRSVRELREPVRLIVNELRQGKPFLFSPAGPLTGEEQELVEGPLDSLALAGLLPAEPVSVGETWRPSDPIVAAVFNLLAITKNELQAKLESLDQTRALLSLSGKIEGVASAAETKIDIRGRIIFDRAHSQITGVELTQTEDRMPGPIEPGFVVEATFTLNRKLEAPITRLNDKTLEKLPLRANPAIEQLVYLQPDGRYRFYFPRGWHVYHSDPRIVVLRLIENGEFVAQCNVTAAPTVAAGNHMKPDEFRTQVQQALGSQFQKFIQEGEVPAEKGHWVYRLAAAGAAGELPVVWYYYLAAGPQGQQLIFTFTLDARLVDQFGPQDLALVGTLDFEPARTASKPKAP